MNRNKNTAMDKDIDTNKDMYMETEWYLDTRHEQRHWSLK
jgi:hypothetical protein